VVAIEGLAGNLPGIRRQEELCRTGHVQGMNFLAAAWRSNGFSIKHLPNQLKPAAGLRRMGQPVNAGRPQGADGPALSQAKAVDEFLQRRLVSAIMAGGPQRVSLVQRAIVQDYLVDGAGGNEHATGNAHCDGALEELEGTREVDAEENLGIAVAANAAVTRTLPLDGRVDESVRSSNQLTRGVRIAELPR